MAKEIQNAVDMLKIALTGPESSGKTTLANLLAKHYNVDFIPEYARQYLVQTNGHYEKVDLPKIAKGQHERILSSQQENPTRKVLISDTDFIVIGVWSNYKYGSIEQDVKALIHADIFDLHILCEPDMPWEDDELRENPDNRDELFSFYQEALDVHGKNYITVNGSNEKRLKKAIEAIELIQK